MEIQLVLCYSGVTTIRAKNDVAFIAEKMSNNRLEGNQS